MEPKFKAGQRLIHFNKECEIQTAIVDDFGSLNQYEVRFDDGTVDIVYENTLRDKPTEFPLKQEVPTNGEIRARMFHKDEPPDPPHVDVLTLNENQLNTKEQKVRDFYNKAKSRQTITVKDLSDVRTMKDLMDLFERG